MKERFKPILKQLDIFFAPTCPTTGQKMNVEYGWYNEKVKCAGCLPEICYKNKWEMPKK